EQQRFAPVAVRQHPHCLPGCRPPARPASASLQVPCGQEFGFDRHILLGRFTEMRHRFLSVYGGAIALLLAAALPGRADPALAFPGHFTNGTGANSTRGYAFNVVTAAGTTVTKLGVFDEGQDSQGLFSAARLSSRPARSVVMPRANPEPAPGGTRT